MIKAVIFDMDGTLIDTEKHLVRCWCAAASEFGYPMKREDAFEIRSLAAKFAEPPTSPTNSWYTRTGMVR